MEDAAYRPESLRGGCVDAVSAADLDRKTAIVRAVADRWFSRSISILSPLDPVPPDTPGRPERPALVEPRHVPRRGLRTQKGRMALIHALCHIELNAIDLALDIVARFAAERPPASFFDGWMQVAFEEAKHFTLLRNRLRDLGGDYGDLPAHGGLWEAAHQTRNDLQAAAQTVAPVIGQVIDALHASGAGFARMSGSGATCFGLYASAAKARDAARMLKQHGWWAVASELAPPRPRR